MKRKGGGAATPPAAAARQEGKHSRTQPGGLLAASSPSDDDTSAAATAFRERAVFKVAILSRVLMLLIATFLGEMFSDFDDSTASSCSFANATALPTKLDGMVETSVGHLAKWDGVYFVDIAQHGYRFEHFHAFFPALPLAISFLNRTFLKVLWVKGFASEYNSAVMAGVFVTNAFFVLSAVELYRLSRLVVKKEIFATKTVLLYCLTPANIFMTAIYSESVFAFFFLRGVRLLLEQKRWESALTLAGTCLTRSNGALCCLFLVYDALQRCPPPFLQSLSVAVFRKRLSFVTAQRPSWTTFLAVWLGTALRCAVVVAPLVGYLAWSYLRYCSPTNPTRGQHEWCDAAVPNIYAYVQAKYWNVGFLNYYEPHQIPNFLLASPIVFLSAWGIFSFLRRFSFFTTSSSSSSTTTPSLSSTPSSSTPSSSSPSSSTSVPTEPYLEAAMVPFVGYWAVLVVVGVLFMHVQVITRFLSACPALYWFCASFYDGTGAGDVSSSTTKPKNESEAAKEERRRKRRRARQVRSWMQYLIAFYFLAYTLIGALLFCNFYPWT